jgi:hypothetical protein
VHGLTSFAQSHLAVRLLTYHCGSVVHSLATAAPTTFILFHLLLICDAGARKKLPGLQECDSARGLLPTLSNWRVPETVTFGNLGTTVT